MILLGFAFPLIILLSKKVLPSSWVIVKLFSSYLLLAALLSNSHLIVFLVWAFLEAANLEHLINNNSNQNYRFIKFLLDPVFLKGSGLTKRFFFRVLGIQALIISLYFLTSHSLAAPQLWGIVLCSFSILILTPATAMAPDWLQEHWITFNLKTALGCKKEETIFNMENAELKIDKIQKFNEMCNKIVPQDLKGISWLGPQQAKNVLLITIESLGKVQLQKGWMPNLEKRKSSNISYDSFLYHQRNTNRGLYSILTGKHPNLKSQMAKSDIVAQFGKMDKGIAECLEENGYHTAFIQGAPSIFMNKDRFLKHLGFSEIIGEESYPKDIPRIKWGMDDNQIFSMALSKINSFHQGDKPWFLSLLTVSTHHPVEASNKSLKTLEDGFLYVDEELEKFLKKLEDIGILESTMVIITGDESCGGVQHILAENMGDMTVILPEKVNKTVGGTFTQSDLALSICDYLKIENEFTGRSIFRDYLASRPYFFANIFQQRTYCFHEDKLLVWHYSGKKDVLRMDKLSLSCSPIEMKCSLEQEFLMMTKLIEASDRGLDFLSSEVIMEMSLFQSNGEEVVKSGGKIKVGLKRGEKIVLRFNGENNHKKNAVVVTWLVRDMQVKKAYKPNTIILPLNKSYFEKEFISPVDSWFDLSLMVSSKDNNKWRLKDIQISKAKVNSENSDLGICSRPA